MDIDTKKLAEFLVRAKRAAYAGDGIEILAERLGFKELEFIDGYWEYRDSYSGFFSAPGQEIVRYLGEPVWAMAYYGGMRKEFFGDEALATKTFEFLKEVLQQVEPSKPYRGPSEFRRSEWFYHCSITGDITDFLGQEHILLNEHEVFRQNYIGGLIISKARQ